MTIVFYDGVCGLCARLTRFAIPRDRHDRLRFAALQSERARKLLREHGKNPDDLDTVYVVAEDGRLLSKARAILYMCGRLGGIWTLAAFFRIFPDFLLNWFYDWVARHRYRWFGKLDACPMPRPEDAKKFLVDSPG